MVFIKHADDKSNLQKQFVRNGNICCNSLSSVSLEEKLDEIDTDGDLGMETETEEANTPSSL